MTRDTHRIYDDREVPSDDQVWAALWAAAPFPRLPDDAPNELRKLMVELDDPKRVYSIHRASRRHNFQLLVGRLVHLLLIVLEDMLIIFRYIHQIRYGCLSKVCTTTTCFSCRRRVAGGGPVRRYNATSARILATYMASLDNPEQGLCHNPPVPRPTLDIDTSSTSKPQIRSEDSSRLGVKAALKTTPDERRETPKDRQQTRQKTSADDVLKRKTIPDLTVMEEAANIDPRSFVQNVFGTVAFKMLEWLTPRNLDLWAQSQKEHNEQQMMESSDSHNQPPKRPENPTNAATTNKKCPTPDKPSLTTNTAISGVQDKRHPKPLDVRRSSDQKPGNGLEPKVSSPSESNHSCSPVSRRPNQDLAGSSPPKGILNRVPKQPDMSSDALNSPKWHKSPQKRKLSRKLSSHTSHVQIGGKIVSIVEREPILEPSKNVPELKQIEDPKAEPSLAQTQEPEEISIPETVARHEHKLEMPLKKENVLLPQSLSCLSIEVVELLCDIMQSECISENHMLYPHEINEGLKRHRDKSSPLRRTVKSKRINTAVSKQNWRMFIEQSIFDILRRPDPLIRSFSDENGCLFDTQTIWYLMLRMTRVAPSLVFDSLWTVAGTLFCPPENLSSEWVKDSRASQSYGPKPTSSKDAANIINICLHALVAAAPLVSDARQLANMSRIRSYGLAMIGTEASSLEPSILCLQYEDAFTNELAFRLARRIFSAISVRRRFTELLALQTDVRNDEIREPDVLEIILGSLKFLDLGTPPILNFPNIERDLHEKRVPTLLLDWARTVMLQEWQGAAEVSSDGPLGGALATMAAIFKNRKDLLLGDIHFRTEYFAERLDPVDMPIEWLSFEPNKRTFHLLDHPFLFNPATLVTYFRAINYSRMNRAYEEAKAKSGLVFSTISEHNLMVDKYRRERLYDRLQISLTRFNVLDVGRADVLKDTFNAIWRREEREMLRPLKVRLGQEDGDEGMDSGGVQQEFFRLAIAEALNPDYGAFNIDGRTQMAWFQPASPEPLWKFELIGMIVSLAVYNGLTLPVTFPKALYRKLLDEEVSELHHIADGWPELASGLTQLLEWDEKNGLVEEIFARTYEFSAELFGQPISREMGPGFHLWPQFEDVQSPLDPEDAPMVTNENRNSYVSDYIRWLTDISVRPQYEAFKKGFFSCIHRRSITLFDPETLQAVVEGVQEIDISEMRRATRYVGWDATHRSVRDFWSIVKKYSLEKKRKLLEFVTASERIPVGGMRNLQFTLQRNGMDDEHLPSSYTCYGILLLPEYSTKEVLRGKLEVALENSKGFGFA